MTNPAEQENPYMRRTPILGALVAAIAMLAVGIGASANAATTEHAQRSCADYKTTHSDAPLHVCATVLFHNRADRANGIVIDAVRFNAPGMPNSYVPDCKDDLSSPQWKKLHSDANVNGIHMYSNRSSVSGCPGTWPIGLKANDNMVPFSVSVTVNVNNDYDPTIHGKFYLCRSAMGGC